jgi:phage terminase large subunit-like protein
VSKLELLALLEERERRRRYNKLASYYPEAGPLSRDHYPRQMEIFRHGREYRERCFQGGNGVGKTEGVGAYETALHATGEYPDWWPGHRIDGTADIWVAGDTKETVRDITQSKLIGDVAKKGLDALGTGMIPRAAMVDGAGQFTGKFRQGTNYACDFVRVKHKGGGFSTIAFKSYDQRRESFQGTEKQFLWLDEEPPMDIYTECVMRGRSVGGKMLLTFTPLSGPTDVVTSFEDLNKAESGASKIRVKCRWDEVPHLTEQEKAEMIASCPAYLRAARMNGEAVAGVGRVYPVDESLIVVKPFAIPGHWPRVFGIDCGWHRTAVVWGAIDRDTDTLFLYSEHYVGEQPVPIHAAAIKARGIWIPGVGDVAGASQTTGESFKDLYRAQGVRIQLPDKSVDGGIAKVMERASTGRLKVFSSLENWLKEFRTYAYDDKQRVKKENDHLMDATRYLIVSGLDIAKVKREEPTGAREPEQTFGIY